MRRRMSSLLCLIASLLLVAAGCGDDRSAARFVPPSQTARQALESALSSWKEGRPAGKVAGTANPQVILVNNCRQPEQTLERFTILGETAGEGPRCFAVRVKLQNPMEDQRLRFVVFGVDPIWVYRYEDYEMMIHWQCNPEENADKSASTATKSKE
jgi:hypothetical protein